MRDRLDKAVEHQARQMEGQLDLLRKAATQGVSSAELFCRAKMFVNEYERLNVLMVEAGRDSRRE
jgi:hypothetical protein